MMAGQQGRSFGQMVSDFFNNWAARTRAIREVQFSAGENKKHLLEEIKRDRKASGNPGGFIQGFLERFRAMREADKAKLQQIKADFSQTRTSEIDRKAVPNQKHASLYSTEEILKGQISQQVTSAAVQAQNKVADARYKDLEHKMGLRPGLDGSRAALKAGPE